MEIKFSQQAAERACNELSEYSVNIQGSLSELDAIQENIRSVWSGDLQSLMLNRIRGKRETLDTVSAYVKGLEQNIADCRKNYKLTEENNAQVQQSLLDLFA